MTETEARADPAQEPEENTSKRITARLKLITQLFPPAFCR